MTGAGERSIDFQNYSAKAPSAVKLRQHDVNSWKVRRKVSAREFHVSGRYILFTCLEKVIVHLGNVTLNDNVSFKIYFILYTCNDEKKLSVRLTV